MPSNQRFFLCCGRLRLSALLTLQLCRTRLWSRYSNSVAISFYTGPWGNWLACASGGSLTPQWRLTPDKRPYRTRGFQMSGYATNQAFDEIASDLRAFMDCWLGLSWSCKYLVRSTLGRQSLSLEEPQPCPLLLE